MINDKEKERIEKFRRLIPFVRIKINNEFFFHIDEFNHNGYLSDLHKDPDLPYLIEKMNNVIFLINKNPEYIDKDVEKDLWELI